MSKIRNLLGKFKKKKKNSQDLDEIFYEENEAENEDDQDSDIGEETIIFDEKNPGDELKPHPTSSEANTPAKSDLQFPKKKEPVPKTQTNVDATRELDLTALEAENPLTPKTFDETQAKAQENYAYDPRLDLTQTTVSEDEEFEYDDTAVQAFDEQSVNFDEDASEFEFEHINDLADQEVRKEIDQEEGFDYTFGNKTFTSEEIDLDEGKITLRDKLDHIGTRIVDRFRIMNKKDLNQAMKPPRQHTSTNTRIKVAKLTNKVQEVQWNKFIDRFLNPANNQNIHHYFQIFIAVIFIYIGARVMGGFIKGKPDYANAGKGSAISINTDKVLLRSDIEKMKTSNVFKTSQVVVENKNPIEQKPKTLEKCTKATTKSSLPIKLHHTVVLQDSVKSIASVTVRTNPVEHLREGDKINSMAKVDKIDRLELIIRNMQTGNCESIPSSEADKSPARPSGIRLMPKNEAAAYKKQLKEVKGIKNEGNDFTIERAVLEEKLQDINSLLKQARAIQINNPDGTLSFKIVEIEPDSVFASLGIRDGDIITTIGGEPIQNLNQVMGMFGKITSMNNLKLGLSRDGEAVDQNYTIK